MREWIVTNGLGGYASLTYSNNATRKFHGLLVASLEPPTKRWVFVSNIFDQIQTGKEFHDLQSYKSIFTFNLFPSFIYDINGVKLKKTIFMPYKTNTTIIKYEVATNKAISIVHTPIINSRHFYDVSKLNSVTFEREEIDNGLRIQPSNVDLDLKIILKDSEYHHDESKVELIYDKDRERNDTWLDYALKIGGFNKPIQKSDEYYLILTVEDEIDFNPSDIYDKEIRRRRGLLKKADLPKKFERLVLSTDNFLVNKSNGKSIVAGYHWFGDWGRDTMIALPGLTLITKRFDDAKEILLTYSKYCRNGLIPNAFTDRESKAVYNTVDASLWFIDRAYQYLKYTNDLDFLEKIWTTLVAIIDYYKNGTDYNIKMDQDFLISHGEGLTWMDVKIGEFYPTPRSKKAVEIQALWYNSLKIMSNLAKISGKEDPYFEMAEKVRENFNLQFDQQYDVIDTKDLSFRPNQIFLVSLDFSMIDKRMQEKIVYTVHKNLNTIFGLRTLLLEDPSYKGIYIGNYHRDIAYHNGTVWPWLLGPFIKSFIKVKNHQLNWRKFAYQKFLEPMFDVFNGDWDGSINEIFDGDPPYFPRGCITQAWSVAEILRTWVEDIENISPSYKDIFT